MTKSILIVDDSKNVRQVMREYLESQTDWLVGGEAEDGAEAIRKAIDLKPDLILMDFSMPGMNGLQAASALKKLLPNVLIIMFTMFDQALGSALSSAAGVDLVIPKPDGLTNLVQGVNRLVESRNKENSDFTTQ